MKQSIANRAVKDIFLLLPSGRSHWLLERSLAHLDDHPKCLGLANRLGLEPQPEPAAEVGRLNLPSPLVLGAGLVKGLGFASEAEALQAVGLGQNIIPGWRAVPAIVGPVEFGSFTPKPRMGNSQPTLWRDRAGKTLYNRVGLRNPGIAAAANFLGARAYQLPMVWGSSLAPDPEETDRQKRQDSLASAAYTLVDCGLSPSWVTVNLSCPNAEPEGGQRLPDTQSPDEARQLCQAVRDELPAEVVVWAKVGPDHSQATYFELAHALAQAGVEAVIATNTTSRTPPSHLQPPKSSCGKPATEKLFAGMSGAGLQPHALRTVKSLAEASKHLPLEVIGCGGVMDGKTFLDFKAAGAVAVQYWSALVFRGPLAADIIAAEARTLTGTETGHVDTNMDKAQTRRATDLK